MTPDLARDNAHLLRRRPRRQIAQRADDGLQNTGALRCPRGSVRRGLELANRQVLVGRRHLRGGSASSGAREPPAPQSLARASRCRKAGHNQLSQNAIGDRCRQHVSTVPVVVDSVAGQQRLHAAACDDLIQVINRNIRFQHDVECRLVVFPDVRVMHGVLGLRAVMPLVDQRRGIGENHCRRSLLPQSCDNLLEVVRVRGQFRDRLVAALGNFQIVDARVEMHDRRFLLDRPFIEICQNIRGVASILRELITMALPSSSFATRNS